MAKRIEDFLVVSDMDGTLLDEEHKVLQRNSEAISRFKAKGGHFTIATGRSVMSAKPYVEMLKLDIPVIVSNGSMVYDYIDNKILFDAFLSLEAEQYVYHLLDQFPDVGCESFVGIETYVLQNNPYIVEHTVIENIEFSYATERNAPHNWSKAIFADDPEKIERLEAYVYKNGFPDSAVFVKSSPKYFEILPKGVNKGTGLIHLAELMNIRMENTAAIGDFYNDAEMVEVAGIGTFAGNAPEDLKKRADLVVCDYRQGAVAELLEHIERLCR
ncbi:Cof-type HAD-IIB family hydrolase [Acetanaerobacterium elongatum]|uniref:Cof subfamily of IIB subfamily of haloacid dehalogenase superfamily/HAD-superfamily hydrolase, subfamily IIB n=1 Tax=Acetanaerobacterium elongatum TaxID=258515 RepID=A0A1G9X1X2_9FIRM|nr:Cof-type HAD-IIB family hydrolase [Acetanaerobacterium elongatum]SDM90682.1 hypothetical protein SAMN05192585_10763 [Acetanaerobacterium elongatum]